MEQLPELYPIAKTLNKYDNTIVKNISISLLSLVFLSYLLAGYFTFSASSWALNEKNRIALQYYERAVDEADVRQKNLYLIKSNALSPSDDKRLAIADYYYRIGDKERAQRYLGGVKSEAGLISLADGALQEQKYSILEQYLKKVTNSAVKKEFQSIIDFRASGKNPATSLDFEPITKTGQILQQLSRGEFENIEKNSFYGGLISHITTETWGKKNQAVSIGELFIEHNDPEFAKLTIFAVKKEGQPTLPELSVLIKVSASQNNYNEAKQYLELAISHSPADPELYKWGVNLANIFRQPSDAEFFNRRLNLIEKIQN